MDYGEEEHSDTYDHTIFAFNVVLTAIVTSFGIVGNVLVLLMLHNWDSQQNTRGNLLITWFDYKVSTEWYTETKL